MAKIIWHNGIVHALAAFIEHAEDGLVLAEAAAKVAAQLLFTYSLASLFALANVFVHDVEYLVGISFSLLFFATPMVYPLSMVPEKYQVWFQLSPLHALIHSWREIMLHGRMDWPSAAYVVLFAALVGFLSYRFYVKAGHRIGELL